jgi:hypothetical protein
MGPTVSWIEDIIIDIIHPLALSEKSYEEILSTQSFRKAILKMVMPIQVARPQRDEFQKWLFETVLGSR